MKLELNNFETDCLLTAVHHFVMDLREQGALGSEEYQSLVVINKYLLDAMDIEISDNLPF